MNLTKESVQTMMTEPSETLIRDVAQLKGNIMILGAGGKVGPTMAVKCKRAVDAAGTGAKVYAVSLFDYADAPETMRKAGVEVIEADISDPKQLAALPEAENIIYMVGRKFGTTGSEELTWHINVILPYLAAQRFPNSRFVSFSTGNVYPQVSVHSGGNVEDAVLIPVGEYGQTCMGRERVLEYCSIHNNTPMLMFRLNYAIDMRYGVLYDIAKAVYEGRPVDVSQGVFNCIWQGDVCEYAIRSLLLTTVPPAKLNVSSPEAYSIRWAAQEFGKRFSKEPTFVGTESEKALFSNCQKMVQLLGYPSKGVLEMMDMVAQWITQGGEVITAPTHFETVDGKF